MIKKLIYILLILPVYLSGQNNFFWSHAGVTVESNLLKEGLISCWEFDETSGSTAYDAHGTNDGTITNCTLNQTGLIGTSFYFNGKSDVRIADVGYEEFSLSIWYYHYSDNLNPPYARIMGMTNFRFEVAVDDAGIIKIYDGGWKTTTSAVIEDSWNHIVVAKDVSGYEIYLNNVNIYQRTVTRTISSTEDLIIGDKHSGSEGVKGKLDQAVYYNKKIDTDIISSLYNSGNGKAYSTW